DGVPIENLSQYRGTSGLFTWGPLPDNNILQVFGIDAPEGTTSPAGQDGIYLMLSPLAPGAHTIHFTGSYATFFGLDVTYYIAVGGSGSATELSPDVRVLAAPTPGGSATWARVKDSYR